MKLGVQLTVCWMIAVSIGGAYAGVTVFSGGSDPVYVVASR